MKKSKRNLGNKKYLYESCRKLKCFLLKWKREMKRKNIFLKNKQNTLESRKRKSVLPHFFKPCSIIQYSIAFLYEGNLKIINMLLQRPDGAPVISCRFENLPKSSSSYENNMLEILWKVYKHSETIEYVKN